MRRTCERERDFFDEARADEVRDLARTGYVEASAGIDPMNRAPPLAVAVFSDALLPHANHEHHFATLVLHRKSVADGHTGSVRQVLGPACDARVDGD